VIHELLQASAEQAIEQAALLQQRLEMGVAVSARFRRLPNFQDIQQYQQVENADDPEEGTRDACADDGAHVFELRQLGFDGGRRKCNADRQGEYHRRMAQGEEKTDAEGLFCPSAA
jgi:hypothetical protein